MEEINKDPFKVVKIKNNFFKKVWYSIVKIEKYPEMAAEGLGRAFIYICKLIAILAIILCLGVMYQTHQILQEGIEYLQNEFPEFSYKEGKLQVETEGEFRISEDDSYVGQVIINTKTQEEQKINEYISEIEKAGSGVIVLEDRIILKNGAISGTISYEYNEILGQMQISEFSKQTVLDYVRSSQIISLYISIFITIFIYSFMMYLLTTLSNILILGLFGYIATWAIRIKMRFVALFSMSTYAITLSTILNIIYIAINIFVPYNMEYFQIMYISVAAIYLVAAIFILKSDFIKKQAELMKIMEAQELVRKELEQKEQEEKENREKKERQKKDKEEQNNQNNNGEAPEGSNA